MSQRMQQGQPMIIMATTPSASRTRTHRDNTLWRGVAESVRSTLRAERDGQDARRLPTGAPRQRRPPSCSIDGHRHPTPEMIVEVAQTQRMSRYRTTKLRRDQASSGRTLERTFRNRRITRFRRRHRKLNPRERVPRRVYFNEVATNNSRRHQTEVPRSSITVRGAE